MRLQVAWDQVRVGVERDLRVGVPKDARHGVEVNASGEQQGCGRMPGVVQAEGPRERLRPEDHAADRAAPARVVGVLLDVRLAPRLLARCGRLAASAGVYVPGHQAGASDRATQPITEVVILRPRLPVGPWEEEGALARAERLLEI